MNLGKNIFVIPPEQFSYISEKKLVTTLDGLSSISCEILNFNRLSHRMELEVSGYSKTKLSESARTVAIANIISNYSKDLKFLGSSQENIDLILKTITELKTCDISLEKFEKSKENITNKYLKIKLDDIHKIYKLYQDNITGNYIDEDDKLTLLSKKINKSNMFEGHEVYIDEFSSFNKVEYDIIKSILVKAKRVSITMCTDNIDLNSNMETDIFYHNKQTVRKLFELVQELGIEIEKPHYLGKRYKFKNDELIHLEQNIYKTPYVSYPKEVNNIKLFLAKNPYLEIENIAKKITRTC
jgi:ATP-dependent helicase/nuclease subunit B